MHSAYDLLQQKTFTPVAIDYYSFVVDPLSDWFIFHVNCSLALTLSVLSNETAPNLKTFARTSGIIESDRVRRSKAEAKDELQKA